jgi:CopA family copper-resistance protein
MKTPDRSQNADRRMLVKLMKPVATLLGCLALFVPVTMLSAATVEYDLNIARQEVNLTGQPVKALTINGHLPGPTLRFTEGDHAVIRVHNQMDVETSIHWHGILLPNAMDGVPFVTYPPIAPGQTFIYEFDLRQSGTYWYHSHTMLQEQRGLFGALVIAPKDEEGTFDRLHDHVVVLSDWTDEDENSVLRTLKRGSEWYSLRKGSGQSVMGAARLGMLGAYFSRELQRMPPMDLSDVYYDCFLLNGAPQQSLAAKPGEKIRLRVIAGSATTFFYLQFAGGPLQVIAADGLPVQPFDERRLLIGVAETYDLIITMPADGSYEFRATAHDGSGKASLWIGAGPRHAAPDIPYPNLYSSMGDLSLKQVLALTPGGSMGMSGNAVRAGKFDQPGMNGMDGMKGMDHGAMTQDTGKMNHAAMASGPAMGYAGHDMSDMAQGKMPTDAATIGHKPGMVSHEQPAAPRSTWLGLLAEDVSSKAPLATDGMSPERPWQPYDKLRALQPTAFDPHKPVREIRLTLDGDMKRYVWFLNNKPLSEADHVEIKRDEVVRFIMINRTMMHHPMHLHGHFFRVLNAQGDYSPLKHTVDVAPMTTTVIEFAAEEFGDWFFHCHLLYHMESGMARVVHYQDFTPDPATAAVRKRKNLYRDPFHLYGQVAVLSQMAQGEMVYANTRHIFSTEWRAGWQRVDDVEWEVTPAYDYYLNRFASVFAGVDLEGTGNRFEKHEGIFGLRYLLPLNIKSRVWVDTAGEGQFAVSKRLELTPRLTVFSEAEYDTKEHWEIRAGTNYLLAKHFSLIGQWHSWFGWGGGLRWEF